MQTVGAVGCDKYGGISFSLSVQIPREAEPGVDRRTIKIGRVVVKIGACEIAVPQVQREDRMNSSASAARSYEYRTERCVFRIYGWHVLPRGRRVHQKQRTRRELPERRQRPDPPAGSA
ncbi:hypothetical protein ACFSGX_02935 [Sphingomonas arantia]|uniref:SHSP domain-containing protein n=1 Tax=Sphingomonas arantia TaxID=1460676 RepID=A0ABW4TT97_9SPHN